MGKACFHCMRILVIIFNLLFVLIGCAIVGVAIFLYVDQTMKGIKEGMEAKAMVDIILFAAIGVGGITIVVSTFGCCGAYHESECLLGTYFFCLFVIVATEIAAGVVGFITLDRESVKENVNKALVSSITAYMQRQGEDPKLPAHLYNIQKYFGCCGANNAFDYIKEAPTMTNYKKFAYACALDENSGITTIISAITNMSKGGCTEKIMEYWELYKPWILASCLGVAVFELIAMVVALSLCCSVRRMEAGYVGVST